MVILGITGTCRGSELCEMKVEISKKMVGVIIVNILLNKVTKMCVIQNSLKSILTLDSRLQIVISLCDSKQRHIIVNL